MLEIHSDITYAIPAGETVSVRVARSTRIVVHGGKVWLTRSDDVADYWLAPGHALRLTRGERLWIGAEGDGLARVSFEVPATHGQRLWHGLVRMASRIGLPVGGGWRTV